MGERAEQEVLHDSGMIEKLLEFGGGGGTILLGKVGQAANVRGIHCGCSCWEEPPELVGQGGFERDERPVGRPLRHRDRGLDYWKPVHLEKVLLGSDFWRASMRVLD